MYQALYRKYRPKSFDDVYGQKNIVETLKNAIINNKLSHAYLFCGPRGTGKTSIAKIIAKTINCENLNESVPCGECINCTQNTVDTIEIDAASNNGVDEIRELKNKISLVPTYGKYKIYIIDEVHMLTISAFNALLKTLEEPPKHIIFILATTDPQKVPATIISRCQRFDFKRIDEQSIYNRLKEISNLENIEIDDEALNEIARIADGGLRDAVNLLDQAYSYSDDKVTVKDIHEINGTLTQFEIEEFFENYINDDLEKILKKIDEYNLIGKNLVKLSQEFIVFLRNTIIYTKAPNYLIELGINIEPYKKISEKINIKDIMNLIKDINSTITDMKISQTPKLIFELLFIRNINYNEKKVKENIVNENIIISQKEITNAKVENNTNKIISQENKKTKEKADDLQKNISREINYNLDEIKQIRIDNTLALFSKSKLLEIKEKLNNIKPMLINSKYSQFVSLLLDGSLRAASEKNLIFMYEINSDAAMFNNNLEILEEIILKGLGNNYKLIAVNKNEWDEIKKEFNSHLKEYKYTEEKNIEQNKMETNSIKNMFEEIIEYR